MVGMVAEMERRRPVAEVDMGDQASLLQLLQRPVHGGAMDVRVPPPDTSNQILCRQVFTGRLHQDFDHRATRHRHTPTRGSQQSEDLVGAGAHPRKT